MTKLGNPKKKVCSSKLVLSVSNLITSWHAAVHGLPRVRHDLATEQQSYATNSRYTVAAIKCLAEQKGNKSNKKGTTSSGVNTASSKSVGSIPFSTFHH